MTTGSDEVKRIARRRRRWRLLAAELLIFVVLFVALKAWLQRDMISGAAPELSGFDLQGRPVSLADFRGRPVLVHFWATWCGICELEQDGIEGLSQDWPVLTVATRSGLADELHEYMRAAGLRQTVLPDPDGVLAARYGVHAVPASFVLDGEGEIRFRETGYSTVWGLRTRLWLARLYGER